LRLRVRDSASYQTLLRLLDCLWQQLKETTKSGLAQSHEERVLRSEQLADVSARHQEQSEEKKSKQAALWVLQTKHEQERSEIDAELGKLQV